MSEQQQPDDLISSPQAAYDALRNVLPESPCPYLPGRMSRSEAYRADGLDGVLYEQLLARGFRRSGRVVYRPRCRSCRECRQIRIPVAEFQPSRSLRRVRRRNEDLRVEIAPPEPSAENYDLFRRYLDAQHDGAMAGDYDSFVGFLYDSPMETSEFRFFLGERLVGVSLIDRCGDGLSSVYMYYEPELDDRCLGTFSVLWEIDRCRAEGLSYYYLGFYVAQSRKMAYKARFRPCQVLVGDDRWVTLRE